MRHTRNRIPTATTALLLIGLTIPVECPAAPDEHENKPAEETAAVVGIAKFEGPRPERWPIRLEEKGGKLSDCHQLHEKGLLDENLIVGDKGEVANVFVYVKKGYERKSYPAPKEPAVLNQEKCMFRPRVQGVLVGQEFLMRNSDPLLHNVRLFSFKNRAFNIAQPAKSADRKKVFKRREKAVMIQCDLHPWMTAHIFVMDHPFFAVSNEQGEFKIGGLPAGEYTLAAWHEELGEQELQVSLSATDSSDVEFSFKPKKK